MVEGWWQHARRAAAVARRAAMPACCMRLARHILATHWGIVLALGLATLLRLYHLEQSQFFDDQAGLMSLAHQAVVSGALPVTGIRSSIGTLNPPLSIYLLLPAALFTSNPWISLVALALWNVLGVLLLYVFTLHYAG